MRLALFIFKICAIQFGNKTVHKLWPQYVLGKWTPDVKNSYYSMFQMNWWFVQVVQHPPRPHSGTPGRRWMDGWIGWMFQLHIYLLLSIMHLLNFSLCVLELHYCPKSIKCKLATLLHWVMFLHYHQHTHEQSHTNWIFFLSFMHTQILTRALNVEWSVTGNSPQ